MQPRDSIAAILADWDAATAAERHTARPIIIERLRAAGEVHPELLLGNDRAAGDATPGLEEILAALRVLPDGNDVAPLLRGVPSALIGTDELAVTLAISKLHEVLRDRGIPGAQAIARAACAQASAKAPKEDAPAGQGQSLVLDDPEPCDGPVDGAHLLDDLELLVRQYVVLSPAAARAIALWIVHTYVIEAADISARLVVTSPQRRCGKSTLLDLLASVVRRGLAASNITSAAMFRVIEAYAPTLLVDEADTFLAASDELRGIINAGHARGGGVIRTVGDDHEPRRFGVFGALALAAIGRVPATIADRAIEIRLSRKTRGERVERLCRATIAAEIEPLRCRLARWADDHADTLRAADPRVPVALHDRQADGWRSLLAIADVAGGTWPSRSRDAAVELARVGEADADDLGTLLLADLRDIFGAADRMPSETIVTRLVALAERPWAEWGRSHKPMTQAGLARLLHPFRVAPGVIRIGDATPRGYLRADLEPVWLRYLSSDEDHDESADRQGDHDDACDQDEVAA